MQRESHELVIVGGGILGSTLAYCACMAGISDILVLDAPHPLNLGADTFRNHAWWQSGLLYANSNLTSATKMFASGEALHQLASVTASGRAGIFRIEESRCSEIPERAERLNLTPFVFRMTDREARQQLDAFHTPGFAYFRVPDATFDEARIVHVLQKRARDEGVMFRRESIRLASESSAANRYVITTSDAQIEATHAVLCAGAGIPKMLADLKLECPLSVFRSALLVCESNIEIGTSLFVDLSNGLATSGLAIGYHPSGTDQQLGRYVIGSRARIPVDPSKEQREAPKSERDELKQKLPLAFAATMRGERLTAGYKTEARIGELTSIDPFEMEWAESFPGLSIAIPGKATLSYSLATEIVAKIKRSKSSSSPALRSEVRPSEALAPALMHHEKSFDGVLNEIKIDGDLPHQS